MKKILNIWFIVLEFLFYLYYYFLPKRDLALFGSRILLPRLQYLIKHHPWQHNFELPDYIDWKSHLVEQIGYFSLPGGDVNVQEVYQLSNHGVNVMDFQQEYPWITPQDVEYCKWFHHQKFCQDLQEILYSLQNIKKARKIKTIQEKLKVQRGLDLLGQYWQSLWWI